MTIYVQSNGPLWKLSYNSTSQIFNKRKFSYFKAIDTFVQLLKSNNISSQSGKYSVVDIL